MNWIRCDERLPNDGQNVLIVTVYGDIHTATLGRMWDVGNDWPYERNDVTHWMPLPEPPLVTP